MGFSQVLQWRAQSKIQSPHSRPFFKVLSTGRALSLAQGADGGVDSQKVHFMAPIVAASDPKACAMGEPGSRQCPYTLDLWTDSSALLLFSFLEGKWMA